MAYQQKRMWPSDNARGKEGLYDDPSLWQSLNFAYADDNSYAYFPVAAAGDSSEVAFWSKFGFTAGTEWIRAGCGTTGTFSTGAGTYGTGSKNPPIVVGIEVIINKWTSAGRAYDALVQLMVDGTVGYGDNRASAGTWGSLGGGAGTLGTAGTYVYGGSRDLWGTSFTMDQVCGTGFGLRFAGSAASNLTRLNVGNISIVIHYKDAKNNYKQTERRRRFPVQRDDRVTAYGNQWQSTKDGNVTSTSGIFGTGTTAVISDASTIGIGTQCVDFSAGTFYSAGTFVMALGSAGTVKCTGGAGSNTFGTGREIYFCSTGGTGSRLLPNGPSAFIHYFINTRGYSATSFTFGTSPVGTGGTQINCAGTVGTHRLWVKWLP